MRMLELEGVSYSYDRMTPVLKDISLALEDTEKLAVIGPNGAGKSTLLHLIAGFRMPFSGSVRITGQVLEEKNADRLRRNVGILFQDPDDQLFMPTVKEDVAFGPRNLGLDNLDHRVSSALADAGISELEERRPHHLSHGMKKRVAIAGVMAMDTGMLLLDEPTAGLDPRSRRELIDLIRGMRKPVLIATHDIEAAAEIADRAVLLNIGVVGTGSVRDLVGAHESLAGSGLEPPSVSKVFTESGLTRECDGAPPVTVEQAVRELRGKQMGGRDPNEPGLGSTVRKHRKPDAGSTTVDIEGKR